MSSNDNTQREENAWASSTEDAIDLRALFQRLWRGLYQIFALALLCSALACLGYLIYSPFAKVTNTTRVVFAFSGFERNQYPDGSKFQADDLRAPDVIAEALKRRGLETSAEFQGQIRAAISIEGNIPANIVRERDRQRAAGQNPAPFIPDEYIVTLTTPRKFQLSLVDQKALLAEIVSVYKENFRRTYADTPLAFGNAFAVLRDADYPDYESIFGREMRAMTGYLQQNVEKAKLFRSTSTNLSFGDLLHQTQLFTQIRLNETIGLIRENGLTRDRKIALVKMNDALRVLTEDERRALEEETVVRDLLNQAQTRERNYVLGVKSQASQPRSESPVLDQGVIDSLLANDSYSFLVRRALDAGLKVKSIQSDIAQLKEQMNALKSYAESNASHQATAEAQIQKSIDSLEKSYNALINDIKKTHADYSRQQLGDAIRMSANITTVGTGIRPLFLPIATGLFLGFALGAGLSLLEIYIGRGKKAAAA